MGLGARGSLSFFIVGALLVLALLKAAVDSQESAGSSSRNPSTLSESPTTKPTGNTPPGPLSHTNESSKSTVKPPTTPVSKVTVTTSKPTAKPSTSPVSKNGTATTLKPTATSKMTPPGVSTNMTSTTVKSTPKITSVSQNTSQMSTATMTTTHNSSVTSVSSVTITATINSKGNKGSKFDVGSFVGGIALTLGILSVLYIGCKVYYSRRGIRYRTIDEHDAII